MLENHDILIEKVKREVQGLFASEKIQNLFVDSLKNSIRNEEKSGSGKEGGQPSRSRTVSDNSIKPNYNLRKTSTEYKDKGLIIPATKVMFGSGKSQQGEKEGSVKIGGGSVKIDKGSGGGTGSVKVTGDRAVIPKRGEVGVNVNNYALQGFGYRKGNVGMPPLRSQTPTNQYFTQNNYIGGFGFNQQKAKDRPGYSNVHIFRDVRFFSFSSVFNRYCWNSPQVQIFFSDIFSFLTLFGVIKFKFLGGKTLILRGKH